MLAFALQFQIVTSLRPLCSKTVKMSASRRAEGRGQYSEFSGNSHGNSQHSRSRGRGRPHGHGWNPRSRRGTAQRNRSGRPYLGANTLPFTSVEPGFEFFKLSFLEDPWLELMKERSMTKADSSVEHRPSSDVPVIASDLSGTTPAQHQLETDL